MSGSLVTGKLGGGKTKFAVWRAQEAFLEGRAVASNVDLFLEHLVPNKRTASYWRVPDKPTAADLDALPHGNPDSYDESLNGLLILDELGTWLNARNYQDKGRQEVIDWLIHARKKGWDVYLIVQSPEIIDKQIRAAIAEYVIRCRQLNKVRIPFIGKLLGFMHHRWGFLPRCHVAACRLADDSSGFVIDRWMYRGDDLHKGYDTRQVFVHDPDARTRLVEHPLKDVAKVKRRWWRGTAAQRQAPTTKAPHPVADLLRLLPPDDRIRHWKRLDAHGAFARPMQVSAPSSSC